MPDPALSPTRAVVCVPVRNEAEALPHLIRSLGRQEGGGEGARLRLLVLANNCTDGTVSLLRAMEREGEMDRVELRLIEARLSPADAHVGTARRLALDAGADWMEAEGVADGVLLSTDADAAAPADWVIANLRALEGADLVGGRLVIDAGETVDPALADLHRRIERYWAGIRALEDAIDPPSHDPAPRHGDHVAASLALRVALYRAVGGLPPLPCGEDNALVSAVRRHGGRVRHCPAVAITVSARGVGRVEGGMATEMLRRKQVVEGEQAYLLPPARHWRTLIERRRDWRIAWTTGPGPRRREALLALGLDPADLAAVEIESCPNDIAFVERIEAWIGGVGTEPEPEPLDIALAGIEAELHDIRRSPTATPA